MRDVLPPGPGITSDHPLRDSRALHWNSSFLMRRMMTWPHRCANAMITDRVMTELAAEGKSETLEAWLETTRAARERGDRMEFQPFTRFWIYGNGANGNGVCDDTSLQMQETCTRMAAWRDAERRAGQAEREDRIPLSPHVKRVTEESDVAEDSEPVEESTSESTGSDKHNTPRGERFTDLGNARRLIRKYGLSIRYVGGQGWMVWRVTHWQRENADNVVREYAHRTAESFVDDVMRSTAETQRKAILTHWLKSERSSSISNMMREAIPYLEIEPDKLDTDPWLFNCANGTIDLRTGELRAPRREDFITRLAPVRYVPGAQAARWHRFLQEIFTPHPEVIPYLQRVLGYAMVGVVREHVFPVLYGPQGRNGKTLLLTILSHLYGGYGISAEADVLMRRGNGNVEGPMPFLSRFAGRRFVAMDELPDGFLINDKLVKNLCGDSTITVRDLYQKPFEFRSTAKTFLATNHRPKVANGGDPAYYARIILIPFDVCFLNREDVRLCEELESEYEGIFAWLVRGAQDWALNGLGAAPECCRKLVEEYRAEMNPLAAFADTWLDIGEAFRCKRADVYTAYEMWCRLEGVVSLRREEFATQLKRLIPSVTGSTSNGVNVWRGIAVRKIANV